MKRTVKVLMIAGLVAIAVFAFMGCKALNIVIEVEGTWIDEFGGKRIITTDTLSVYNTSTDTEPAYVFNITDFDNSGWNGGETGTGDSGYAVLLCTAPPSWNPEQEGTYTIFRWQNLTTSGTTAMEHAEGSPPTWPTGYEDSAADAITNATGENGWFGLGYVSATLQP